MTGLERRNKIAPWCDPPGMGRSSGTATGDNLYAMERLRGRCGVPAGPRVCTRLACAFGGGVFLCNDVSFLFLFFVVVCCLLVGFFFWGEGGGGFGGLCLLPLDGTDGYLCRGSE